MKRFLALILTLVVCITCVGCGGGSASGEASAVRVSSNVPAYTPGTTIETKFGTVAVMDAAFCTKAQIFFTKTTSTTKTTVNGETTETHRETIHPGTVSAKDDKIVFAIRTVVTNTTQADIELHPIKSHVYFTNDDAILLSKGGNFHISDEGYKILPAGKSAEIIMAGLIPVDQYMLTDKCVIDIEGAKLSFQYGDINVYNILGFLDDHNQPATIDDVIRFAAENVSNQTPAANTTTEPLETEPPIETFPGTSTQTGTAGVDGRALSIKDVKLGFLDQLPNRITSKKTSWAEDMKLNDSQVYAVIQFTVTNLTSETVDLADIHDDFIVQMNYNYGYLYATNTDLYALYESGTNLKRIRSNGTSGQDIAVAPLTTENVTVYIPCARLIADNPADPLVVNFICTYAGSECMEFTFDRSGS